MAAQTLTRRGDLEIDAGYDAQERLWIYQRIGWVAIAALIVLALLGAFGGSLLGKATAKDDAGILQVGYDRFGQSRSQFHPSKLTIQLNEQVFQDGTARLYIDRTYLDASPVTQISPEPDSQQPGPERTVFVFSGQGPSEVTFTLQARTFGKQTAHIGLMDGDQPRPPATFSQFIYP